MTRVCLDVQAIVGIPETKSSVLAAAQTVLPVLVKANGKHCTFVTSQDRCFSAWEPRRSSHAIMSSSTNIQPSCSWTQDSLKSRTCCCEGRNRTSHVNSGSKISVQNKGLKLIIILKPPASSTHTAGIACTRHRGNWTAPNCSRNLISWGTTFRIFFQNSVERLQRSKASRLTKQSRICRSKRHNVDKP